MILPHFIYAQEAVDDTEGTLLYIYMAAMNPDPYGLEFAVDNEPLEWILVNKEDLFHSLTKPIIKSTENCPSWDSLYYATNSYLTFRFGLMVEKYQDTARITDAIVETDTGTKSVGWIDGSYVNGVKEGVWQKIIYGDKFEKEGFIIEGYKNGKLHGVRTSYGIDGSFLGRELFVDGTGQYVDYYPDSKKPAVRGTLVEGNQHGLWSFYNKADKIIREEHYKHGLLHGPFVIYNEDGVVIYETHFREGTGEFRRYKNNRLVEHGKMENGYRMGVWKEWGMVYSAIETSEYTIGINESEISREYTRQSPVNDPGNIIDMLIYDGEYVYVRAKRDK